MSPTRFEWQYRKMERDRGALQAQTHGPQTDSLAEQTEQQLPRPGVEKQMVVTQMHRIVLDKWGQRGLHHMSKQDRQINPSKGKSYSYLLIMGGWVEQLQTEVPFGSLTTVSDASPFCTAGGLSWPGPVDLCTPA